MRTISIRTLGVAALALVSFAASAAAQTPASPILNALEVRMLVSSTDPADNARLSVHFAALADRYTAEAKQHELMAQSSAGNPSRNLGASMSAHCRQLAALNTEAATIVRELAAHHQKLAGGTPSTPPAGGVRYQGGAGAPEPTDEELAALAARASTPAEHHALEEYFLTAAKRYTADADEHVAMGQAYRGTRIAQSAVHCDRLVAVSRDEAREATAAAEMHKQLAGVAR